MAMVIAPLQNISKNKVKDANDDSSTPIMLVKLKSKMLMETSCQNVDEGVVDDAEIIGESSCRNPGEGEVNNTEIGGDSLYESSDEVVYDIDLLCHDPKKRIPIKRYVVNEQNYVIKAYISLGPCQLGSHNFPIRSIGSKPQCFMATWFDEFRWLEYSVEKDDTFCSICYLFKHKTSSPSGDAFVKGAFRN
jgi:hypothetical protein